MVGQGDFDLSAPYKNFAVPIDTWANLPKQRRDNHMGKFMQKLIMTDPKSVMSTDGKRVYTGPGTTGGKKPHQRKRKRTARTTTITSKIVL